MFFPSNVKAAVSSVLQRRLLSCPLWRVIKSFWRTARLTSCCSLKKSCFMGCTTFVFSFTTSPHLARTHSSWKFFEGPEWLWGGAPPPSSLPCPLLLLYYLLLNPASVSFISAPPLSVHLWGLLGGILFSLPAGFVDTQSTYASLSPLPPLFLTLHPHLSALRSALTEQ